MFSKLIQLLNNKENASKIDNILAAFLITLAAAEIVV
jgi:hypothetical protein